MSHPDPANADNTNDNVPDDIFLEEEDMDFAVHIAEMGLVRSINVSTTVLAYLSNLSPKEFFMFKGALGTPDARIRF